MLCDINFFFQKRKEFNDIDSFDTSDEEMKELLAFHKNLKKPKHL